VLESSLRARRWLLLAVVMVMAALLGLARTLVPDSPALLLGLVGQSVAFAILCLADSRVTGKPVSPGFVWACFLLWPVAVPGYLLWSRGWLKGAGLCLLFACLWLMASVGTSVAVHLAAGLD
jgi:hypothetical protein